MFAADPVVSIITPTYNQVATVSACLRSAATQSFTRWEQVVVDDGSTDGTWDLVRRMAARDGRIRCIRQAHRGLSRLAETYNDALAASRGRLVAILEGDDLWPRDKLAWQVALHVADESLVLSHGRTWLYAAGRVTGRYSEPPTTGRSSGGTYLRLALLRQACIVPVSAMLSRAALEAVGGFAQDDGIPAVDYPTWLRLFAHHPDAGVWFASAPLGLWRQSPNQVSRGWGVSVPLAGLRLALDCYDQLPVQLRARLALRRTDIARAHWRRGIAPSHLATLRGALVRQRRAEALTPAWALVRHGGVKRRAQGLAGLLCAALGLHLEGVFALAARGVRRSAIPEAAAIEAWAADLESWAGVGGGGGVVAEG